MMITSVLQYFCDNLLVNGYFITILLFTCLLVLFINWVLRRYEFFRKSGIPTPPPTFLVGNMWPVYTMQQQFGTVLAHWYHMYPDQSYIGFYNGMEPSLLIRDPDIIKDVLIKEFTSFSHNNVHDAAENLLSFNPFGLTGEKWKRSRSIISQIFAPNKIKVVFPLIQIVCNRLTQFIENSVPQCDINAKDISSRFTTDNVAMCAFSLDGESFTDHESEFHKYGKKIFEPTKLAGLKFMIMLWFPTLLKLLKISFIPADVDVWFRRFIKENIASRKNVKLPQEDFLQLLINMSEKFVISDTELAGHSLTFFIEGYESSSTMLAFTMYELARDVEVQERLFNEVNGILERDNGPITMEAVNDMKYLDAVICETLRLRPVGLSLTKLCTQRYTLPKLDTQGKSFVVQPKTVVNISIQGLHMDSKYFPDPEKFDPDRFEEEQRKNRHKMVFIPFNEGPRMCPGMKFGMIQTKMAIINVIRKFRIRLSPNCKEVEINPNSFMLIPTHPLLLNFELRK